MRLFLLVIGVFWASVSLAQNAAVDQLYRIDRSVLKVRVEEMTGTDVLYIEPSAPKTVKKIPKTALWKVVFSNGSTEVFNEPSSWRTTAAKSAPAKPSPTKPTSTTGTTSNRVATAQKLAANENKPALAAQKPVETAPKPAENEPAGTAVPSESTPPPAQKLTGADGFSAGSRALSFSPIFNGTSTTNRIGGSSTSGSTNQMGFRLLFQHFRRENTSLGIGLVFQMDQTKNAGKTSQPLIGLSAQIRRFIPLYKNVAVYGQAVGEVSYLSSKQTSDFGEIKYQGQIVTLSADAGALYRFNPRWSVDFTAKLATLTYQRAKSKSSEAEQALSVGGVTAAQSFLIYITRYF